MAGLMQTDFFKTILEWATQNGYKFENQKFFDVSGNEVKIEDITKAMTNAKMMAQFSEYLEDGYSLSKNFKLRKDNKFVSSTDTKAQEINKKIEEKRAMINDPKKIADLAKQIGWEVDGQNFKSPDGDVITQSEMKLMLLSEGMFRTEKEIIHDNRTVILSELDKIKNASLKRDPKLAEDLSGLQEKLKAQRRSRIRLIAGAALGVGIIAASGGFLAPVAAGLVSGAVAAGSVIPTLGVTGIGLLAGTGIAAGFGTNYALKAYSHFRDPTVFAAKVAVKLGKQMKKVNDLQSMLRLDPNNERLRKNLEKELRKENEYAAKQAAKAAKKRDKFEKKLGGFAGSIFGFDEINKKRIDLYRQSASILEEHINNNNEFANDPELKLNLKNIRGKSALIVNKEYAKQQTVSKLDVTKDIENEDLFSEMISAYVSENSDKVIECAKMGKNGLTELEKSFKSKQGFDDKVDLSATLQAKLAIDALNACKFSSKFDVKNDNMKAFMQKGLENVGERLSNKFTAEGFLDRLNDQERDLINQIYGPEIVLDGPAQDGQTTGFWSIDNRGIVQEMQKEMINKSGNNFTEQQKFVNEFNEAHKLTTKIKNTLHIGKSKDQTYSKQHKDKALGC